MHAAQDRAPALLAGPLIWGAHFVLCYVLLSIGCALGWQERALLGLDLIRALLLALTAAAAAALVLLLRPAWRARRRAPPASRPRFMAAAALGLHVLSLIAVVWLGMAVPLIGPCY